MKSQAAFNDCCVGPLSLIDASDLNGLTIVSGHTQGNQSQRSLSFDPYSPDDGFDVLDRGRISVRQEEFLTLLVSRTDWLVQQAA